MDAEGGSGTTAIGGGGGAMLLDSMQDGSTGPIGGGGSGYANGSSSGFQPAEHAPCGAARAAPRDHQQQHDQQPPPRRQHQQEPQQQAPQQGRGQGRAPRRLSGLTGAFRRYAAMSGERRRSGSSGAGSPQILSMSPTDEEAASGAPMQQHAAGSTAEQQSLLHPLPQQQQQSRQPQRPVSEDLDVLMTSGDEMEVIGAADVLASARPYAQQQQEISPQLQPVVDCEGDDDDADLPSSNLTVRLSSQLASTYSKCSPRSSSAPQQLPPARRVLTHPSAGVKNEGWDNEAHDLVLATGDVLINASGQR